MTKQHKIGIGLVLASLILLLGVVYFSRAGIRRSINGIRADRLYKQAQEAYAGEVWGDVVQKGRAAYYLNTDDKDVQLLVARALLKQKSFDAVSWWHLVLDKPDLPVDDLRELTRNLLAVRMYAEAMPFLERLVELDSANPETQNLWLTAMQGQRHISGSRALAETLVKGGSEDWSIHQRYLSFQQTFSGSKGKSVAAPYLKSLIEKRTALSVLAARELAILEDVSPEDQLLAAQCLEESSEDPFDALLAFGLRAKNGTYNGDAVKSSLESYLASGAEAAYLHGLEWAIWMRATEAYLDIVAWETYRSEGGEANLYLRALMDAGRFQDVVGVSQTAYSESDPESIIFLAYRAAAYRRLGMIEQADATLEHAVQIVNPEESELLERFLLIDGQWDLLVELYETLLVDNPDNMSLLYRYLAALYYTGKQDKLAANIEDVELSSFEGQVGAQSFIGYLKLMLAGANPELHNSIETLMSQYPEVYDFRLIVGMSYLLQGNSGVARLFTENMPVLDLTAPRHLRICAAILENSSKDRFGPAELEYLLPRELYLLSRVQAD